jgi:hypothetical protein
MTKLAFDATGNLLNAISSRDIDESVLSESYPQSTIVKAVHRDVQIMRKPIKLVGGVVTEAPPPTEEELAAIRLEELKLYTEESGLRYGCGIIDPLTGEPSGDSNAPIGVIRQQTGQARNHLVYLKLDGTEAQKVSAANCQAVEENLSLVVAQTIVAVQAGTITTKVEIDEIINAVNLSYT